MSATEIDDLGPVDYLVVEFPAGKSNFSGEMAAELASLGASLEAEEASTGEGD
jgi:hypothetical protein